MCVEKNILFDSENGLKPTNVNDEHAKFLDRNLC